MIRFCCQIAPIYAIATIRGSVKCSDVPLSNDARNVQFGQISGIIQPIQIHTLKLIVINMVISLDGDDTITIYCHA